MITAATAYLVVAGEYDDYRVIAVLAVEAEAHAFADDHNLHTQPRRGFWAEVEPVEFYAAGWRPAPREVLDGDVVDVHPDRPERPERPELIP
jgi:hypothetical protein